MAKLSVAQKQAVNEAAVEIMKAWYKDAGRADRGDVFKADTAKIEKLITRKLETAKPVQKFTLISENMTGLGGPMGTERTWANWKKVFGSEDAAKKYAEKDYAKECGGKAEQKIKWSRSNGELCTGDLRFVMYIIRRAKLQ